MLATKWGRFWPFFLNFSMVSLSMASLNFSMVSLSMEKVLPLISVWASASFVWIAIEPCLLQGFQIFVSLQGSFSICLDRGLVCVE